MNSDGLVSVVMIFLDAARFMEEAIESVLAQTYPRWELLLVDDGSTDGSTDIALRYQQRYPEKVRYFEHANHGNRGMAASRNVGISHAEGEYIGFLDADDVLMPSALEEEAAILSSHPEVCLVYGSTQRWYGWTGNPKDSNRDFISDLCIKTDIEHQPPKLLELCLRNEFAAPAICSLLARRVAIQRVGGFEEDFREFDDTVLLSKIFLTETVYVSGSCWSRYRQHPEMSCARAEEKGQWHPSEPNPVRLEYLTWLEVYLAEQERLLPEIRAALNKELLPYRHRSMHHVYNSMKWWKLRASLFISRLLHPVVRRGTSSLAADPNPVHISNGSVYGRTRLVWHAAHAETVEIHISAPDGPLFSRSGSSGSAVTESWVYDGMPFYLQNVSGGKPLTLANTLDVVRVRVISGSEGT